jgi:hypothetical protein
LLATKDNTTPAEVGSVNHWPKNADDLPMYLTSDQYAELRGCTVRTLERERQDGMGARYTKLGRRVMYRREAVLDFLQRNEFSSTAEARRADRSSRAA